MTIQDTINEVAQRFDEADLCYGHGTDNALDEAFYLIYGLLGLDFSDGEAAQNELAEADKKTIDAAVQRRIFEHIPTAYLLGRAWFAGHEFRSDERALVPRSPIAELILNDFSPLLKHPAAKVLDMCTGGGSIGLAIALRWPNCRVDLVDVSEAALDLARENSKFHGLSDRVRLIHSDLFRSVSETYDLIVSNPPYVPEDEYSCLPAEYEHEPSLGLLSEDGGLDLPLKIMRDSVDHLSADGLFVMEVGYSHERLAERLEKIPLLWLDFASGGEGVLALTARQLQQYREHVI